jgi:ERCC4-type nuclease
MILVDDRTGSVEIAPLLQNPVICRLEYADFAWSGNGPNGPVDVGVERKTLLDLLSSMTTGRLSGHQIIGLTQHYDWVYLLVEGIWKPDKDTGMLQHINRRGKWAPVAQGSRRFMVRDVYNFLNTLQVMCGIVTVTTSNHWETARWLTSCNGWWEKGWSKHKSHLQFQKPIVHAQLSKPSLVTRMASQLTGVGWDKARKIGSQFPTMEMLMDASEEDLTSVEGIGPRMAERIWEELHT